MSTTYAIPEGTAHDPHGHPWVPLTPGCIVPVWCHVHGPFTPHRYEPGGKQKLVCVECEKEPTK